ncbi:cell envelope protein SmpA [Pseudomonas sp. v388]|uniref:cell envelope protein SmpA n=1 Tax=Pseudomonas sp. v388 TaxID=2479849 RepID=UPI000F7A8DE7|nr:cell envelope protein SmpA [Pseudomonas sp. v388]RRV07496.1 cell envelope protein SmpA [Pseudomonas sp. v388]
MRIATRLSLCCALITLPAFAAANSVQRCEDGAGNVSFTTLGCPASQSSQTLEVYNPSPGSVTPAPMPTPPPRRQRTPERALVVVGQRDDGCGNRLSPEQRRQAIINQRTPPGMTVRDVESLLGRPDKIVNRNGQLSYQYKQKKGRSNTVTFDANGCVKGKR